MDRFEQQCLAEQDLGSALERLALNPDFQLAIQKAYLQDHALNCLHSSTDARYTDVVKGDFLRMAHATSALDAWIGNSIRLGLEAPHQLEEHREALERTRRHAMDPDA